MLWIFSPKVFETINRTKSWLQICSWHTQHDDIMYWTEEYHLREENKLLIHISTDREAIIADKEPLITL